MSEIQALVSANLMVPVGKNGKVSKATNRAAAVMQDASAKAIISAAVFGKGTTKKLAVLQLQGLHTVEYFTNRAEIDGGEWADFLQALVARHGERTFNPSTMRGKAGVVSYLRTTRSAIELKGATDDWTDALTKKLAQVEEDLFHAERLMQVAIEAAARATEAKAE